MIVLIMMLLIVASCQVEVMGPVDGDPDSEVHIVKVSAFDKMDNNTLAHSNTDCEMKKIYTYGLMDNSFGKPSSDFVTNEVFNYSQVADNALDLLGGPEIKIQIKKLLNRSQMNSSTSGDATTKSTSKINANAASKTEINPTTLKTNTSFTPTSDATTTSSFRINTNATSKIEVRPYLLDSVANAEIIPSTLKINSSSKPATKIMPSTPKINSRVLPMNEIGQFHNATNCNRFRYQYRYTLHIFFVLIFLVVIYFSYLCYRALF